MGAATQEVAATARNSGKLKAKCIPPADGRTARQLLGSPERPLFGGSRERTGKCIGVSAIARK